MSFSFEIVGEEAAERALRNLPAAVQRRCMRRPLRDASKVILDRAKQLAPVRKKQWWQERKRPKPGQKLAVFREKVIGGQLKKSLSVRVAKKKPKGSVFFNVQTRAGDYKGKEFYGAFQEYGWNLGKRSRGVKRLQEKRRGATGIAKLQIDDAIQMADNRRRIPGKHYMGRAYAQTHEAAERIALEGIRRNVESLDPQSIAASGLVDVD